LSAQYQCKSQPAEEMFDVVKEVDKLVVAITGVFGRLGTMNIN